MPSETALISSRRERTRSARRSWFWASPEAAVLTRLARIGVELDDHPLHLAVVALELLLHPALGDELLAQGEGELRLFELADAGEPLLDGSPPACPRAPRRASARAARTLEQSRQRADLAARPRCRAARALRRPPRCRPGCGARHRRGGRSAAPARAPARPAGGPRAARSAAAAASSRRRGFARSCRGARGSPRRPAATRVDDPADPEDQVGDDVLEPTSRTTAKPSRIGRPSSRTTRISAACLPNVWPLCSPLRAHQPGDSRRRRREPASSHAGPPRSSSAPAAARRRSPDQAASDDRR